jgi:hypothetical protein
LDISSSSKYYDPSNEVSLVTLKSANSSQVYIYIYIYIYIEREREIFLMLNHDQLLNTELLTVTIFIITIIVRCLHLFCSL